MATSTSKASIAKKKTSSTKHQKSAPQPRRKAVPKVATTTQSSRASDIGSSRRTTVTVEEEEDEEANSVGGTLDVDGDMVMEEVVKGKGSVIELLDEESAEEDEESELSELPMVAFSISLGLMNMEFERAPLERLDCSSICLLQAYPNH